MTKLRSDLKAQMSRRVLDEPSAVWTPIDFLDGGTRTSVDKALQRMVAAGYLRRLDRGLYYLPNRDPRTGKGKLPSVAAVLDAVSRRDQTRLLIDGAMAAFDLGFAFEPPVKVIVLIDARLRPIQLGDQEIVFRQVAPSKLHWAGRPAMRIVQTMYWLHEVNAGELSVSVSQRLSEILGDPWSGQALRRDLIAGLPTLPIWMQDGLRALLEQTDPAPTLDFSRPSRRQPR
jgi:hypothetical protein